MLTKYIQSALLRARYEVLKDVGSYYGEIRVCRGVFANSSSLELCRSELVEALEDWILFRIYKHLPLPKIGGIELNVRKGERS